MVVPCFQVGRRVLAGRIRTPGSVRWRSGPGPVDELERAAKDLSALLQTARESDGDRLRCKNCGSFIPGVSKLKLSDILAVIRELKAFLPAQHEHEGLPPIQVIVAAGGPIVPCRPDEE